MLRWRVTWQTNVFWAAPPSEELYEQITILIFICTDLTVTVVFKVTVESIENVERGAITYVTGWLVRKVATNWDLQSCSSISLSRTSTTLAEQTQYFTSSSTKA